ncbi:MAG TPA: NUDIX hydrolase [Spirochaetota bacterium]|nr:NUDIX hydrolase [Spirochaetota bacterium]HPI88369.1 NUDIX hydrolase [Spirochaetota bacterium]HPR46773.1 NUDIX hydrolase [Spirochaetota bacterium]
MKKRVYCSYCGNRVIVKEIDGKKRDYCADCGTVFYENPLPVACAIVANEKREVLLVKRARDPYRDMWCLPIGFAESGENIQHAALRELKEEAGIDGTIIRLIDVDTVENYFYGSLAIVTYEVKPAGLNIAPGDDASDAGFFNLESLPPLAWKSNEKAIEIFIDLHRDHWSMVDSFSRLFPESQTHNSLSTLSDQRRFLSDILIQIIHKHIDSISEKWQSDLIKGLPDLVPHLDFLLSLHRNSLKGIQFWLKRGVDTLGVEEFIEAGFVIKSKNIPLPGVLSAMALSRKALWVYIMSQGIISSPLEIYTALEINNRIIFFYDKINYYLTTGYFA